MEPPHLWDIDHPYYCNESNHFASGWNVQWESWAEFAEGMGASDKDLNLLFRWDWERYEEDGDSPAHDVLKTFWVMQRKGIFACHEIAENGGEWLRLTGNSHKHWRLVIGNAVPVQAAEAIARACAETLEESRRGGWSLTWRKIWVTPRTGLAA
jgi:hypothetical protein